MELACVSLSNSTTELQLYERVKKLLDTGQFTIQSVRVALTGLRLEDLPDPDSEQLYGTLGTAVLACLSLLSSTSCAILQQSQSAHPTKEKFVSLLVDSAPGICAWQRGLLDSETRYSHGVKFRLACSHHATVLRSLLVIDTRVVNAFLDQTAFLDMLFMLWTAQDMSAPRDIRFVIDYNSQYGDAILNLLRQFVYTFVARDALIDKAASTNIALFATGITARAVNIRADIIRNGFSDTMISFVQDLVDFLGRLLTSDSAALRWALEDSDCLAQFGHLLYDIAIILNRPGPSRKLLKELVHPCFYLSVILSREKSRAARNWADLVGGRFEATLSFITTALAPNDEGNKQKVTESLRLMGRYSIYPCVLAALIAVRQTEDRTRLVKAQETPNAGDHWKDFWISAYNRAEMYADWLVEDSLDICDNLSVSIACVVNHSPACLTHPLVSWPLAHHEGKAVLTMLFCCVLLGIVSAFRLDQATPDRVSSSSRRILQ